MLGRTSEKCCGSYSSYTLVLLDKWCILYIRVYPFVADFLKSYTVFKLNDYLGFRTRQQFWEEPAVRRILEGIKNKEIDMKSAAELLGVSYGTLYGRYREVFGYLKHSWVSWLIFHSHLELMLQWCIQWRMTWSPLWIDQLQLSILYFYSKHNCKLSLSWKFLHWWRWMLTDKRLGYQFVYMVKHQNWIETWKPIHLIFW